MSSISSICELGQMYWPDIELAANNSETNVVIHEEDNMADMSQQRL